MRSFPFKSRALAVALAATALSGAAYADTPAQGSDPASHTADVPPVRSTTHRHIRINGVDVAYTVTIGETYVPAVANGPLAGVMVNTAYVRDGVEDEALRPVIFLFNGGPGASSWMEYRGVGPRLLSDDRNLAIKDNNETALDAADLVFINPVGTGLSRVLPGHDVHQFWTSQADAQSVKAFIQQWLKDNHRDSSPKYVFGESYGTTRAAEIVRIGSDLHLDGVVLLSSVESGWGEDIQNVTMFPSFATTAAFHGRAPADGRTPEQVFADNQLFARTRYAAALIAGSSVSAAERDDVAAEMSKRLGITLDLILKKNLRLSREDFMLNILKDRGLRTGQLDSRKTGDPAYYAKRVAAYTDPGMDLVMGPPRGTYAQPDDPQRPHAILGYLRDELRYPLLPNADYIGLNFDMLFQFKHSDDPPSAVTAVTRAMQTDAHLRLLVAGGFYDLTTPLGASIYAVDHSGAVRDRIELGKFAGSHETYETNRNAFAEMLRRFLVRAPKPAQRATTEPAVRL